MSSYSLYLHIPFCRKRCNYCDFITYSGIENLIPGYVEALCREIEVLAGAKETKLDVHSVFFGGGTPTILPAKYFYTIIKKLGECFHFKPEVEISVEANPGTVTLAYLHDLKSFGVNRLSIGMQSANPMELRLLGREHDIWESIRAVNWARKAGFDNLNLDLIFGLPGQTISSWQNTVNLAVKLHPQHFSLYALSVEKGTRMRHWIDRGLLSDPDDDLAAEMYEWVSERLAAKGYVQYEISNWALSEKGCDRNQCLHNLQYWRNLPYLGIGAGSHGFAEGFRIANVVDPADYIQRCMNGSSQQFPRSPASSMIEKIDKITKMKETMMMGLRLVMEGVSGTTFQNRFGISIGQVFGKEIEQLMNKDLLEWVGERDDILRLTSKGRLLGNQVFMCFI